MDRDLKFDPNFAIEEDDDQRTHGMYDVDATTQEPQEFQEEISNKKASSDEKHLEVLIERVNAISSYYAELRMLVNLTGQASYYWHMMKGLEENEPGMKRVSLEYKRSSQYYGTQWKKCRYKGFISIGKLKEILDELGEKHLDMDEKVLLNMLAMSKDRRAAYRDYISAYEKKGVFHTLAFLEEKYQKRLKKRPERAGRS